MCQEKSVRDAAEGIASTFSCDGLTRKGEHCGFCYSVCCAAWLWRVHSFQVSITEITLTTALALIGILIVAS